MVVRGVCKRTATPARSKDYPLPRTTRNLKTTQVVVENGPIHEANGTPILNESEAPIKSYASDYFSCILLGKAL